MKMKVFIIAMVTCIMSFMTAYADVTTNYDSEQKFLDNWSVGIDGGVQTNLHEWNNPQGGIIGVNLNKQLSPVFGLTFESYMGINNTGNWFNGTHVHNGTAIDNVNVFVSGRWNVFNTFAGYKGSPRLFELETTMGIGYNKWFFNDAYQNLSNTNAMLYKVGLNLNFNLGKEKAWAVAVKPALVFNMTDASYRYNEAMNTKSTVFQVTAGVTYHFNTSNGTHHIVSSSVTNYVNLVNELNEQVNTLRNRVDELENAEPQVVTLTTTVFKDKIETINRTYVVTFAQDSYVLSDDAMANLDNIPTGANVTLTGYASPEGTSDYNMALSSRRCHAVKVYLIDKGVNVTDIVAKGAENNESNRLVIVTVD